MQASICFFMESMVRRRKKTSCGSFSLAIVLETWAEKLEVILRVFSLFKIVWPSGSSSDHLFDQSFFLITSRIFRVSTVHFWVWVKRLLPHFIAWKPSERFLEELRASEELLISGFSLFILGVSWALNVNTPRQFGSAMRQAFGDSLRLPQSQNSQTFEELILSIEAQQQSK
ncbi:hypothetical protein Y032_0056g2687 [Ancylostoma ceylanicum]|uniref:Uncharacterized protein n=1 Tax=Ancylostoma ceylanicum TaxID=53326 RepID=A0A016U662_9BILA|nr:hypothetical protein Y032_0056g2687 [Ancylostoma ceylanicum]